MVPVDFDVTVKGSLAGGERRVLLVRHASHAEVGSVLSGRSAIGLSAAGQAEAEALAAGIAGIAIASMHTSPRRRAQETAAPIAAASGLTPRIASALDEIDFGGFTGLSFAALKDDPDWRRWNAERDVARCPGGETMAEAHGRVAGWLGALPSDAFPALCVTHCDIIRALVTGVLGLSFSAMFRFDCDPAALTVLDLGTGGPRLVSLNQRLR